MTVKELVELNQKIVDVEITVRVDGHRLLDQLNIGCAQGVKPRFPTKVPIDEAHIDNIGDAAKREAAYIDKSINAWDDGRDYYEIKTKRIPADWLDLEVFGWDSREASTFGNPRRRTDNARNVNFHGEMIRITALPSGQVLSAPKQKEKPESVDLDGQMSIDDWDYEEVEI